MRLQPQDGELGTCAESVKIFHLVITGVCRALVFSEGLILLGAFLKHTVKQE